MRTEIATIPLDYGRCPKWLFERMRRLGQGIAIAIMEEFGPEEFLKRLSDPVWFQRFGCCQVPDLRGLTSSSFGRGLAPSLCRRKAIPKNFSKFN